MSCILFDGKALAREKEQRLKDRADALARKGIFPRVVTCTFSEDEGSTLYTRLKKEAATRIGISYEPSTFSLNTPVRDILDVLIRASQDHEITGIMIQKPVKQTWMRYQEKAGWDEQAKKFLYFADWWSMLVEHISVTKDVDCLVPSNLAKIARHESVSHAVYPATVRAVLSILDHSKEVLQLSDATWRAMDVLVVGRSDIVGNPLAWALANTHDVVQYGRDDFEESLRVGSHRKHPSRFDIIISATGKPDLITAEHVKPGAIVIDVGAPRADVEEKSVRQKVSFLTPVPGGVGPVTVVSLMENIVEIAERNYVR